ncbi:podocalyxin [Phyllostomus hastatus]|uniref:podocalyxin n=1 Tax=Phyllostomus hastatus TaxID=9423 RepID=UPI001E683017|nr:podocalyxin [Phyllostomus hastatus]
MSYFYHHLHFISEEARFGESKQLISPGCPVRALCSSTDLLRRPAGCGFAPSPAPAQPCPARPPPARSRGRGRGPARTGRESPQPPARPQPLRHRPRRSRLRLPYRLAPSPSRLCRSGREKGPPVSDSGAPVTARPPQPPPGLRALRPRSHRSGSRSLSQPRSHLLWARGQDTMSSALALSALLLLLPPLPSLSQNDINPTSMKMSTTKDPGTTTPTSGPLRNATTAPPSTKHSTEPSGSGVSSTTVGDQKGVQGSGQAVQPTQKTVPVPSTKPATITSQERNNDTAPTGIPGSHKCVATEITATTGRSQTTPPTLHAVNSTGTPPATPSSPVPTGSPQVSLSPTALNAPGSSPKGPPPSRSPDMMTSHTTPQGTTNTPTIAPSVTSAENQQTYYTKTPAVTASTHAVAGTIPSVPGASPSIAGVSPCIAGTSPSITGTLPPTVSPSGPVTPPSVRPTSSSTHLAPTAPQDSNIPFSTSALKDKMIKCEPPKRLNETMLILNVTKNDLCAGSPSDDKLAALLCRAAKANFDASRDQCHIWLVPSSDVQAVAIKEITVQTKLLPKDMYELLKDKWDDLKEVGVSNMQLGDQGPPEETEDRFSMPLIITIVCMASFLLLVAALYGCCHQRLSHRKDQQRLTEELQTVENGYHDNPTLEVMETSSEMQEKKVVNLNGELGDSWIVPLDNLMKDDLDEEEDTHL